MTILNLYSKYQSKECPFRHPPVIPLERYLVPGKTKCTFFAHAFCSRPCTDDCSTPNIQHATDKTMDVHTAYNRQTTTPMHPTPQHLPPRMPTKSNENEERNNQRKTKKQKQKNEKNEKKRKNEQKMKKIKRKNKTKKNSENNEQFSTSAHTVSLSSPFFGGCWQSARQTSGGGGSRCPARTATGRWDLRAEPAGP